MAIKLLMIFDSAIRGEIMSLGGYCRRDVWHSMCADRISRSSDARRNQSSMPSVPEPLPIRLRILAIMALKELAKDGVRSMHPIFISSLTVSVTGTGSLLRRFSFCWSFVNLKGSPWLERALSWNVMLNLRRSSGQWGKRGISYEQQWHSYFNRRKRVLHSPSTGTSTRVWTVLTGESVTKCLDIAEYGGRWWRQALRISKRIVI